MPSFGDKQWHQAMRSAGHRVSVWNGGRDDGFLGERVIRHRQRGGQADDKRPCQGCASGEISRGADLRGVAGTNRARGLSHPDRSTSGSVRSSWESLPADRRFLSRNLIQTASRFFGPFLRAAETNLCDGRYSYSNERAQRRRCELDERIAVASVQILSPSGRSRRMDSRSRATSVSNIGELTASTQPSPRGAGRHSGGSMPKRRPTHHAGWTMANPRLARPEPHEADSARCTGAPPGGGHPPGRGRP